MKRKTRVNKTLIRRDERTDGAVIYTYELIMSENESLSSYRIPLYSIRVEKTSENGETTYSESEKLFADLGSAVDFYEKLINYMTTPTELPYLIEDEFYTHR